MRYYCKVTDKISKLKCWKQRAAVLRLYGFAYQETHLDLGPNVDEDHLA